MRARIPARVTHFSLLRNIQTVFERLKQLPVQQIPLCYARKKWLDFEAYHPALSSVEVKNEWVHTSTPPYAFTACTKTNFIIHVT
jgi:hypothetical protein